jgi:hypothetical protein
MLAPILKKMAMSLPIHYKPDYENPDIETFFKALSTYIRLIVLKCSDLGSDFDLNTCFYSKSFEETE